MCFALFRGSFEASIRSPKATTILRGPTRTNACVRNNHVVERNAVRFTWREGDMVTLDNMITAHARDSYVGPRKIVVALGDLIEGTEIDRLNSAKA